MCTCGSVRRLSKTVSLAPTATRMRVVRDEVTAPIYPKATAGHFPSSGRVVLASANWGRPTRTSGIYQQQLTNIRGCPSGALPANSIFRSWSRRRSAERLSSLASATSTRLILLPYYSGDLGTPIDGRGSYLHRLGEAGELVGEMRGGHGVWEGPGGSLTFQNPDLRTSPILVLPVWLDTEPGRWLSRGPHDRPRFPGRPRRRWRV